MKKWLAFVLVLLIVPVWCFTAGAEDAFSILLDIYGDELAVSTGQNNDKLGVCNGFAYEIIDAETAEIKSVGFENVIQGKVTIPDTLDGRKITGLSKGITLGITARESVSKNKPVVKSIIIPDSIENINPGAFSSFEDIETFAVSPDNPLYESVDGFVVSKTDHRLVYFPKGKKGSFALPEGIEIIGSFSSKAEGIVFPDSVKSIEKDAYFSCEQLTAMSVPASMVDINRIGKALAGCKNLKKFTVRPDDQTNIELIDNILYDWNEKALCTLPAFSAQTLVVPDGIQTIPDYAFYQHDTLVSVILPNGVTSIGDRAFSWCKSLTSINIPNSLTSVGYCAFDGCTSLTSIPIPDSVTTIGDGAFELCNGLTSITIPDSWTTIGDYVFSNCHRLTSITIPDSVTTIGNCAFASCWELTSVTIPDSVTSIGNCAFSGCSFALESVIIPDGVKSIGKEAFKGCKSMKEIVIPDSVVEIGEDVFKDCNPDLLTVKVAKDSYAMKYCEENHIKYEIID